MSTNTERSPWTTTWTTSTGLWQYETFSTHVSSEANKKVQKEHTQAPFDASSWRDWCDAVYERLPSLPESPDWAVTSKAEINNAMIDAIATYLKYHYGGAKFSVEKQGSEVKFTYGKVWFRLCPRFENGRVSVWMSPGEGFSTDPHTGRQHAFYSDEPSAMRVREGIRSGVESFLSYEIDWKSR